MIEVVNNEEVLHIIRDYFCVENPFTIYSKTIVYKEEKKIKGILIYDEIYDRIEISYVLVLEGHKRQGIGSKLLAYLDPNKSVSLEVKESNVEAIQFYQKNGFNIVAKRSNYYHGEDGYLMCKGVQ